MTRLLIDLSGVQAAFDADRIPRRAPAPLGLDAYAGTWLNANAETPGLTRVVCTVAVERLDLRAFGAGSDGPRDWGTARDLVIYGSGPGATQGSGLSCRFEFGFLTTRLQANLKGGVMVAVTYNTFTDGSRRRPYFMREFLVLDGAP